MFIVGGEALFDLFPQRAPPGPSLPIAAVAGGSPLNVAIGLARLGQKVAFLGGVSRDPLGERIMSLLAAEGVETSLIARIEASTALSLVAVDAAGQPSYAFHGHRTAETCLEPRDLPMISAGMTGLHLGSYAIAVEPVADALLDFASRFAGRLVTLDPNVRLGVQPDPGAWRDRIARLASLASVVKASEEDIALLWPGRAAEDLAREWRCAGAGLVVVTRGAQGAVGFTRDGRIDLPGRAVEIADTVGAGDAFQAALIDGMLRSGVQNREDAAAMGMSAVAALMERAILAASLACARRGADLATAEELHAAGGGRNEKPAA
jgi:fructokinase